MTASALHETETSEGDDGTTHELWTPCADSAADHGFIAHRGLHITGIDDATEDHLYPVGFIFLDRSAC
ncbi:hypothetical protein GCM10020000_84410 [Streptomyces olivoverticillatus]